MVLAPIRQRTSREKRANSGGQRERIGTIRRSPKFTAPANPRPSGAFAGTKKPGPVRALMSWWRQAGSNRRPS